jgi:hypothetical protein
MERGTIAFQGNYTDGGPRIAMQLTKEHVKIAANIDTKVKRLISGDSDDLAIFAAMTDYMPDFKRVMDESGQGGMDVLCQRFAGFHHYAKILENVAKGVESGEIKVPKTDL